MSSLSDRRKIQLKLNVAPRTTAQLWEEYGPGLQRYYNIMQYTNSKIVKKIKNVSKGSNKNIDMEGDDNGYIYAVSSAGVYELEQHMKILLKYLEKPRPFEIPLLYYDPFRYVTSYINFDKVTTRVAKTSKNSLQYCEAEGKFLIFMINEVKLLPLDVESYVSRDTQKLAFLDFGEFHPVTTEDKRRAFIDEYLKSAELSPEVVACIVNELN